MLFGYAVGNAAGIALYAARAILGGLLSTQSNVNTFGETVYSATITAKGPVATTKQVVKPSQLIGYEDPGETVYFGKLTTRKYQAALAYRNNGTGRPRQSYAVAWDPTAKKPLGLIGAEMANASDSASGSIAGIANFGNTALDILSIIPGLEMKVGEGIPTILSAVSAFLTPGPITPDSAFFSGSAIPFTALDGWAGYGQNGENFRSGLSMMWVDKGLRDSTREMFGGKSLADIATRVMDMFVKPGSKATPAEIIETVTDILGEFPDLAKDGSNIGFVVGYGQGTMNFDKKTQTAVISGVSGQSIVLDKSSSDVPYETWNIYTGRSFSALFADLADMAETMVEDGMWDNADWSKIPEMLRPAILNLIPNVPGLVKLMVQREAFGGYGTYSIKLVKGAGEKITAADGAEARIAAFLKAVKAPKYVTADDVIDYRANYLDYMFNGRTVRPAVIELPRATFLSAADQMMLSQWEQENTKEAIGNKRYEQIMIPLWPMTPENVLMMTGKILARFEDGENYISYNADTTMPLGRALDICLFGNHLYDNRDYVSAAGFAEAEIQVRGEAILRNNRAWQEWYIHDLILGTLERSSIGREMVPTFSATYVTGDRSLTGVYPSEKLYLKVLEDAGYDGDTSFTISGLEGIKALFGQAAETAALRLDSEKKVNEAEWKAGSQWRFTSYAAYKLIIQAIEGMEMIRDSKVRVLNDDAREARALGIK